MSYTELLNEHEELREQLEVAYASKVWNTAQIDLLANRIVEVEMALARRTSLHAKSHAARLAVPA
jgi:hypothetical protein